MGLSRAYRGASVTSVPINRYIVKRTEDCNAQICMLLLIEHKIHKDGWLCIVSISPVRFLNAMALGGNVALSYFGLRQLHYIKAIFQLLYRYKQEQWTNFACLSGFVKQANSRCALASHSL
jgi:hypothetical protein